MNIETLYKVFLSHPRISTDTRQIETDSIFFALKGQHFDGNEFVLQALQSGASFAVADDAVKVPVDQRIILVEDSLETLQQLAAYHRQQFKIPVIGITGTNGKTTTKELVASVLSSMFEVVFTKGNLNNHIGVPLTLLEIKTTTEIAVIEMGANHPGEIGELCKLAQPTVGIITNIGLAHLEGFINQQNIIETKRALYESVRMTLGTVFLNADNELLVNLATGLSTLTFSTTGSGDIGYSIREQKPYLAIDIQFEKKYHLETRLTGNYNAENVMAAFTAGIYYKVPVDQIIRKLSEYTPSNNRSQVKQTSLNLLILDAYNANPSSMLASITHFLTMQYTNMAFIIGDMLELGEAEHEEHLKIVTLLITVKDAETYFVGPVFHSLCQTLDIKSFETVEEARMYFRSKPIHDKTVFIKGSRGIHLERLYDIL